MSSVPRLALGTVQAGATSRYVAWGLLNLCRRGGERVRHFYSRACFSPTDGASVASGTESRHLDSWLMSPELCREVFVRGAQDASLSVVEGEFWTAPPTSVEVVANGQPPVRIELPDAARCDAICRACGGRLDLLCKWLELPRIGVVDLANLDRCRLLRRPDVDAIILDGVSSANDYFRWRTSLEPLWGIPVVGGLELLPNLRRAVESLPPGVSPECDVMHELANQMSRYINLPRIRALAGRCLFPDVEPQLFRPALPMRTARPVRVGVAYDAAFHCYFPDTLDLLEMHGAEVVDFSPLKDCDLPEDVDIVYLGCGHPERYAEELAANHCFLSSLRNHVCSGRRLYAEGGGLAYLCRELLLPDGRTVPMTGILPAVARRNDQACVRPVDVAISSDCWLGRRGMRLRGYLSNGWQLEAASELSCHAAESECREGMENRAVVGRRRAVGSRMHLNFALQPEVFGNFVQCERSADRCW